MTKNCKKKLIEVAIPLDAINKASAREKSIRHGHPSTFHLWWARRPLAACRAILFLQLVDDPSSHPDKFPTEEDQRKERERLFHIVEEMVVWENSNNEELLLRANKEILNSCDGELPRIYDPFSGGCSIPLEAQRLGLPSKGSDLNPVAVLIGKSSLVFPAAYSGCKPIHYGGADKMHYLRAEGMAEDVLYYAKKLNELAWGKLSHLYPEADLPSEFGGGKGTIMGWLWVRTVASPNPAVAGAHTPLISTYWLCKKKNKKVWIKPIIDGENVTFEVQYSEPLNPEEIQVGNKVGRGANFRCLLTDETIPADYVKTEGMAGRMGWKLSAIVVQSKKGRVYVNPTEEQESLALSQVANWKPEQLLSTHSQYMSVTNYGPKTIGDLFMERQALTLDTFAGYVDEVKANVYSDAKGKIDDPATYAEAVATYLGMCVSRLANRQSTSTFWDNGAENIQQVFAMQALPMRWRTVEGNPFSTASGNFIGQAEYLAKAVAAFPAKGNDNSEEQKDAQNADFTNCVVSTDPPYYDNVPYADLSDFFYVWLKRSLKNIHPDIFQTLLVPKSEELVADHKRHDGKDNADDFFLKGMTEVMQNMASQARSDIPATIYYAFRQGEVDDGGMASKGWATFLQSVIVAGYTVVGTWPVRTELVGNLKKNKNALATSVVLVCRPRTIDEVVTRAEFIQELKNTIPTAVEHLHKANVSPVDIPQAAIGPGIGVFSKYTSVLESDDSPMTVRTALQIVNQVLDEYWTDQEGDFDPDTRFAISWFEQHRYDDGEFGDADNLSRARGVSVENVKHAGIIQASAGKVKILERDQMELDWSPETDSHLTDWECCQYLVRALENSGEYEAAILIKKMGGDRASAAKDVAYRLFDICNKNGWAKEGTSYNGLIAVWPELTAQAASLTDLDLIKTGEQSSFL